MHRSPVVAAALAAIALLSTAASAKIPSVANSTLPSCISLVGTRAGVADAAGTCTIVLRDLANNPDPYIVVVLDFSHCSNVRVASVQPYGGETGDCTLPSVRDTTDAQGRVTFRVVGSGRGSGAPGLVRISGEGVYLREVPVHVYDLDGYNGVDANDLSAWLADLFSGASHPEADYDCNGSLGSNDLSLWLAVKWAGGSAESAAPTCGP